MKQYLVIIITLLLASCSKEDIGSSGFSDDFESYSTALALFDATNWTYFEQTYTDNTVEIVHDTVFSGGNAIRLFSKMGESKTVSKADLASHDVVLFRKNDVIHVSFYMMITGNQSIDKLFILDIEDAASISSGPGIRLLLDPDNALVVERHKMNFSNISQNSNTKVPFPRNQWVKIVFECKLSPHQKGYVKLWQDDQLLIDKDKIITLPSDLLYVTQGTHRYYRNVEVGITANNTGSSVSMFLDKFSVWKY